METESNGFTSDFFLPERHQTMQSEKRKLWEQLWNPNAMQKPGNRAAHIRICSVTRFLNLTIWCFCLLTAHNCRWGFVVLCNRQFVFKVDFGRNFLCDFRLDFRFNGQCDRQSSNVMIFKPENRTLCRPRSVRGFEPASTIRELFTPRSPLPLGQLRSLRTSRCSVGYLTRTPQLRSVAGYPKMSHMSSCEFFHFASKNLCNSQFARFLFGERNLCIYILSTFAALKRKTRACKARDWIKILVVENLFDEWELCTVEFTLFLFFSWSQRDLMENNLKCEN